MGFAVVVVGVLLLFSSCLIVTDFKLLEKLEESIGWCLDHLQTESTRQTRPYNPKLCVTRFAILFVPYVQLIFIMKSTQRISFLFILFQSLVHIQALEDGTPKDPIMIRGTNFRENDPTRRLHVKTGSTPHGHHHSSGDINNSDAADAPFPVDISSYSLRFEKCQGIKAGKEQQQAVQRYAVFRLCPRHACSSCNENYGEYSLPLETYLNVLSDYFHGTKDALCETCQHCQELPEKDTAESKLNDFGSNCVRCEQECTMLDKLESSGYVDATKFLKCSLVQTGSSGENYYAGPVCSSGGDAVTIGIFTDEYCSVQDTTKNVQDFIKTQSGDTAQLAYSFMKLTYLKTCLSCAEDGVEGLHDLKADQRDADNVKGFCESIYDNAAKCETPHGFALAKAAPYGETAAQEREVCNFIDQIHLNDHSSHPKEFIADDLSAEEAFAEEEVLDVQSLIMIIVGAILVFLFLLFKCLCNSNASSFQIAPTHGEKRYTDNQVIKVSSGEADETEEESSSSSMIEIPPVSESATD